MLEQNFNLSFEIIRPLSLQIQTFKIRLTTHEMSDEIQNQQKKDTETLNMAIDSTEKKTSIVNVTIQLCTHVYFSRKKIMK